MKCPKCASPNAYQPLLRREIECENPSCSLHVPIKGEQQEKHVIFNSNPCGEIRITPPASYGDIEIAGGIINVYDGTKYLEIRPTRDIYELPPILKTISLNRIDWGSNKLTRSQQATFELKGYFNSEAKMHEAIEMMKAIFDIPF